MAKLWRNLLWLSWQLENIKYFPPKLFFFTFEKLLLANSICLAKSPQVFGCLLWKNLIWIISSSCLYWIPHRHRSTYCKEFQRASPLERCLWLSKYFRYFSPEKKWIKERNNWIQSLYFYFLQFCCRPLKDPEWNFLDSYSSSHSAKRLFPSVKSLAFILPCSKKLLNKHEDIFYKLFWQRNTMFSI